MGAQALDAYKGLDPTAQAAILGGGAGAAIGGVGNAMFGSRKRGLLSRLGIGALAGGGVGALGGAGVNEMALRARMADKSPERLAFANAGVLNPDRKMMAGAGNRPNALGISPLPVQKVNDFLGGLGKPSTVSKPNMQIDPLNDQIQDAINKGQI
jgi:hypothetical protein